jgi:hypothetical protein
MKPDPKANHVKILVYTAAENGYPPEEWESLWAIPMGGSLFKINNIPFFAKGLSCDDVVSAAFEGDTYIFSEVVTPSQDDACHLLNDRSTRSDTAVLESSMKLPRSSFSKSGNNYSQLGILFITPTGEHPLSVGGTGARLAVEHPQGLRGIRR